MQQHSTGKRHFNTGKLFFILSIGLLLFWLPGLVTDVYHFAFVGAVYEILWLPMLAMLIALPALSFIFWAREKFSARSFYFYSLLIVIATIGLIIFGK